MTRRAPCFERRKGAESLLLLADAVGADTATVLLRKVIDPLESVAANDAPGVPELLNCIGVLAVCCGAPDAVEHVERLLGGEWKSARVMDAFFFAIQMMLLSRPEVATIMIK